MNNLTARDLIIQSLDRESIINLSLASKGHQKWVKEALAKKIYSTLSEAILNNLMHNTRTISQHALKQEMLRYEEQIAKKIFKISVKNNSVRALYGISELPAEQVCEKLGIVCDQAIKQRGTSYEQVTRNLPNVDDKIKKLPKGYDLEVLGHLEKGEWEAFVKHNMDSFAYQSLKLFKEGKISYTQFTTCMFYWSLRRDFKQEDIFIVPLFHEKGYVNPAAKKAMLETFKSDPWKHIFTKKNLDLMLKKMKTMPKSEQFFFFVRKKEGSQLNTNSKKTIMDVLQDVGFNAFMECHLERVVSKKEQKQRLLEERKQNEINSQKLIQEEKNQGTINKKIEKLNKVIKEKKEFIEENEKKLRFIELFNEKFMDNAMDTQEIKNVLEKTKKNVKQYEKKAQEIKNSWSETLSKREESVKEQKLVGRIQSQLFDIQDSLLEFVDKLGEGYPEDLFRTKESVPGRMCPSLSIYQEFVNSFAGPNAITFTPVIGLSTLEEIESNGVYSTRDMGIAFPGVALPDEADGFSTKLLIDFFQHDVYHGFSASLASELHRRSFIQLGNIIKETGFKTNIPLDFLNLIVEKLNDMEITPYLQLQSHLNSGISLQEGMKICWLHHLELQVTSAIALAGLYKEAKEGKWVRELVQLCIEKGFLNKDLEWLSKNTLRKIQRGNSILFGVTKKVSFILQYLDIIDPGLKNDN